MRNGWKKPAGVAVLAGALALGLAAGAPAQENDPREPLARLAGKGWRAEGTRFHGARFAPVVTYEWGVNRKIMHSKSFAVNGEEKTLAYETVYAWHPQKKSLVSYSFGRDGTILDSVIESKGDTLEFNFLAYGTDGTTTSAVTGAIGGALAAWRRR